MKQRIGWTLLLSLVCANGIAVAEPKDPGDFVVMDFKLGMSLEEAVKLFPNDVKMNPNDKFKDPLKETFEVDFEYVINDYIHRSALVSNELPVNAGFTSEPFGKGLYHLIYHTKSQPESNPFESTSFLKSFESDLAARYGDPDETLDIRLEDEKAANRYYCWGKRCPQLIKKISSEVVSPAGFGISDTVLHIDYTSVDDPAIMLVNAQADSPYWSVEFFLLDIEPIFNGVKHHQEYLDKKKAEPEPPKVKF